MTTVTTQQSAETTASEPTDSTVVNDDAGTDVATGTTLTCVGVPPYSEIPGIGVWCNNNCNQGNCPATICLCM